ncbi:MlaD family protein [Prosthecomicrobium pneumaticum]|uniref:Phospholipid/cholesterol/gamma-HCH transport system substrate-binding protein n=1 Tax=Prosthecomicrobium pneumaticum TaxID=81895 RepID=A0A7W9FQN5_9HYPH|nr:MlaD family protein [Prosthecomicrobium pneumaticum]MBB5755054.1 phospholipid/cholesterol/gamma-HCH transport system substrate-binding protein [Prosthecomicrobium pneumaticum]
METRANYATIGLFTLAVVAMCFGFVYWLARYDESGARREIRVLIPGSVTGLAVGGQVLFNGIRIGEVSRLRVNPDNPAEVEAIASVVPDAPVKEDTQATLGAQGLTGLAYIEFRGGSADEPNLLASPETPTIVADGSGLQDLIQQAQEVVKKVDDAVGRVDSLLDTAAPTVQQSLENVRTFTGALAENADGVSTLMDNIGNLSKEVGAMSGRLSGAVDRANAILDAVDPATVRDAVADARSTIGNANTFMANLTEKKGDIDDIVANARDIAQKVNAATTRLDGLLGKADDFLGSEDGKNFFQEAAAAARSVRHTAEIFEGRAQEIVDNLAGFTGKGLADLQTLLAQLSRSASGFDRAVRSIESNPQGIIFGNPQYREYNRR